MFGVNSSSSSVCRNNWEWYTKSRQKTIQWFRLSHVQIRRAYVMRKSADDIKRCVTVPTHDYMKTYPGKTARKRRGGQQTQSCSAVVLCPPLVPFLSFFSHALVLLLSSGCVGQLCALLLSFCCPLLSSSCPAVVRWPRWSTLCPPLLSFGRAGLGHSWPARPEDNSSTRGGKRSKRRAKG